MVGEDVQAVVDALAGRLGRSVAVDDPAIRLIAASRHFGDEDPVRVRSVLDRQVKPEIQRWILSKGIADWTEPGTVTGNTEFDIAPRLCFPVRCNGMLLGYVWLIGSEDDLTGDTVEVVLDAADSIALILYRRVLLHERERFRAESSLRLLLSPDSDDRARAVAEIQDEGLLAGTAHAVVLVAEIDSEASADDTVALEAAAEHLERRLPPRSALTLVRRHRAVVVIGGARPLGDKAAREIAEHLRTGFFEFAKSSRRCVVGIGADWPGLESVADSYRQAATAVRAALLLPMFGDVTSWASLGPFALLLRIDLEQLTQDLPFPGVADLFGNPEHQVLVTSVEEFLDRAGDAGRTAEALHVHRTTLYHRLKRVETITGLSLDDGLDRLTLHLALKLSRISGTGR